MELLAGHQIYAKTIVTANGLSIKHPNVSVQE